MKKLALIATIFIMLALAATPIPPISQAWASPDTATLRPNGAGQYQEWETLVDSTHYGATSDQSDLTYIATTGASSNRDIQALEDPTFYAHTITSVQVFFRVYVDGGGGAAEKIRILERQDTSERLSGPIVLGTARAAWAQFSGDAETTAPDAGSWTKAKVAALQVGVQVDTLGTGETMRVSEIWVVVDYTPTTWASYKENYGSLGGTACDIFQEYATEHTVYMEGTGFTGAASYKVIYWYYIAPTWYKRYTDSGVKAAADSTLQNFYTFVAGEDQEGNWQASVYYPDTHDPTSYDAADPYMVANDTTKDAQYAFYVAASAIPEFSTVISAIAVAGLCFGIYYWMRKKFKMQNEKLKIRAQREQKLK